MLQQFHRLLSAPRLSLGPLPGFNPREEPGGINGIPFDDQLKQIRPGIRGFASIDFSEGALRASQTARRSGDISPILLVDEVSDPF